MTDNTCNKNIINVQIDNTLSSRVYRIPGPKITNPSNTNEIEKYILQNKMFQRNIKNRFSKLTL